MPLGFIPPKSKITSRRRTGGQRKPMSTIMNRQGMVSDVQGFQDMVRSQSPQQIFGMNDEEAKDYTFKPGFTSVRGIPVAAREPVLKKEPPVGLGDNFLEAREQTGSFGNLLEKAISSKNIRSRMSPLSPSSHKGFIGDASSTVEAMMGSKDIGEFVEFKTQTDQLFQRYRSAITGAQAAVKELQLLRPLFPKTTDPPSIYFSRSLAALEDMKRNDLLISDYVKKQNFMSRGFEGEFPVDIEGTRQRALATGISVGSESNSGGIELERKQALEVIEKGGDPKKVAAIFKQRTGLELYGR